MSKNIEQVNKLREYLKKTKADNYPIEGHLLEKKSDYNKNLYFRMLCMVIQYSEYITEEQSMLLQRLVKGCKAEHTLQDYMRQSFEIGEIEYKEFVEQVLADDLRYVFVVDILIITHLNECNDTYKLFIAEIIESCRISDEELEYLVGLCVSIMKQDIGKYLEVESRRPMSVGHNLVRCYLKDNGKISYSSSENSISISSLNVQTINLSDFTGAVGSNHFFGNKEKVLLCNLEIDLKAYGLYFENIERVELIGCTIIGGAHEISCKACKEIRLVGCVVSNFSSKTIYSSDCSKIIIKSSEFNQCIEKYTEDGEGWLSRGSVIYGNSDMLLVISNSKFVDCGCLNEGFSDASSILSNCKAAIKDSIFEKCWNYYGGSLRIKSPRDERGALFSHLVENRDNEVIDSTELGPK